MATNRTKYIDTVYVTGTIIPAGAKYISCWNKGEHRATFDGQVIEPDQVINLPVIPDGTYPVVTYDKLTSELFIVVGY